MNSPGESTPSDLEQYRSYLKLIAQMQLSDRLRIKEDPSDIVQRVMLAAYKDFESFRGTSEGELKAWLAKITANVIAITGRHYSRQRRELAREVPIAFRLNHSSTLLHRSLIGKEATPSTNLVAREQCDQLLDALLKLSDDERSAIVLKHLHNWPIAEIATHLGRTDAAIAGLLRRGLAKLRLQLCAET